MHAKAFSWPQAGDTCSQSIERLLGTLYLPVMEFEEIDRGANIHLEPNMGMVLINAKEGVSWQVQHDSSPIMLSSGEIAFIPPGFSRSMRLDNSPSKPSESIDCENVPADVKLIVCQMQFDRLSRESCGVCCREIMQKSYLADAEIEPCKFLVEAILSHFSRRYSGWEKLVQRLIEAVVVHLIALQLRSNSDLFNRTLHEDSTNRIESRQSPTTDRVIGPVVIELLNSPERPWSVPQMAQRARVSKSTFTERFHSLVGKSPLQYLTAIRMQRARKLLTESDIDVASIASMVGYETPSSFSNAFKKIHGIPPAGYREQQSQGSPQ